MLNFTWCVYHHDLKISVSYFKRERGGCWSLFLSQYWGAQPFPSPGDLPNAGIEPRSPTLQADSLPAEPPGKPQNKCLLFYLILCVCLYTSIYFFGKVSYENINNEKSHSRPCLPHSSCYPHGLLIVTIFISFSYILSMFPYKYIYRFLSFFSFPFLFFYWRIIALQNFVVFCQTSTWISHKYTYTPSLLNLPPISPLSVNTDL